MSTLLDLAETALKQRRFAAARDALEQALQHGLDARAHNEARSMLGLALVGLGQAEAALIHLRAAATAEPGEAIFRHNLGRGLSANGELQAAVSAHAEAVRLAPGLAALQVALAQAQLASGQPNEALAVLEQLSSKQPAPAAVVRLLVQARAAAGDTFGALDAAKSLLPANIAEAHDHGRADAMTAASLASGAMQYGDAVSILDGLVHRDPADADAATALAQLLLWTEGPDAARARLRAARQAGAVSPRLLVELLSHGEPVEAEALALAERAEVPSFHRADLLLALAQAADRAGEPGKAWAFAARGKALVASGGMRNWRAVLDQQLALYHAVQPAAPAPEPPQHLYLLGTPRSGQSLVQSILAAAPQIASAGERGALLQHLLFRADHFTAMDPRQRGALLQELALADQRGIRRLMGESLWIVDKSPLHLFIAGNIARVHPAARFAAALRDPADVAVSIWLRRFPPAYDYANDFGAILDHIDVVLDAFVAWRDAGLAIRMIDFEQLLTDPSAESARLFDWLAVEWAERYLDPAHRTSPVPTHSAAQVRQPIARSMSGGAARYEGQLAPFGDRLSALRAKQEGILSAGGA